MMDQEGRSPWPRYDQSQRNNRSSNTNGYGRSVAFPRGKINHYVNSTSFDIEVPPHCSTPIEGMLYQ